MYVIIVGCGRVGAELASLLSRRDHDVTVIDHVGSSFSHLDPGWRGRTIEAEPLAEGVLERAGHPRGRRASPPSRTPTPSTPSWPTSRAPSTTCRTWSSRNYDPRWRPLHEAMGLQMVSSTAWGAQRDRGAAREPRLRSVFSAGNGEVEVYELAVPRVWAGRTPRRRSSRASTAPSCRLTRGGRASLPSRGARCSSRATSSTWPRGSRAPASSGRRLDGRRPEHVRPDRRRGTHRGDARPHAPRAEARGAAASSTARRCSPTSTASCRPR